jgi:hypothetical protein
MVCLCIQGQFCGNWSKYEHKSFLHECYSEYTNRCVLWLISILYFMPELGSLFKVLQDVGNMKITMTLRRMPSSGMCRRLGHVRTDISVQRVACLQISKNQRARNVSSSKQTEPHCQLLVSADVIVEVGVNAFIRNVGSSKIHTAPQPRRWYYS